MVKTMTNNYIDDPIFLSKKYKNILDNIVKISNTFIFIFFLFHFFNYTLAAQIQSEHEKKINLDSLEKVNNNYTKDNLNKLNMLLLLAINYYYKKMMIKVL